MNIGDTIQFFNAKECADYMIKLAKKGITTEFLYNKDGEKGLWLEITEIENNEGID